MSGPKMLILRGNSANAGTYPDEQGNNIAWPVGALHVWAASEYARRNHYEPVVLDIPGQPQSETSPQATEALKRFLDADQSVTAFYGFSGGGYNLWWILLSLAKNHPETLHRIDLVVVLGAPKKLKPEYEPSKYNELVKKSGYPANWEPGKWDVVYRTNPPESALPKFVPKGTETHMFGPEALLNEVIMKQEKKERESRVRFSPIRVRGHH
jgi:hypothetical protein